VSDEFSYDDYLTPIYRSLDKLKKDTKTLEKNLKKAIQILCDDDYSSIIPQLKELLKQLGG